jgi:hypothetical protein
LGSYKGCPNINEKKEILIMFVKEFVEKYKNGEIENLKETLAIRDYAPFAEKYDLCSR